MVMLQYTVLMIAEHGMNPQESHLQSLNSAQREAATHTDGPLLIVAGAGAGKTKTIAHRILHLIHQGVPPQQILAITFTNSIKRWTSRTAHPGIRRQALAKDSQKDYLMPQPNA